MRRLFFGIAPGPTGEAWFAAVMAGLSEHVSHQSLRWTKNEKIHLTLGFLGHVAECEVPRLCEVASSLGEESSPFQLRVGGIGGFPHLQRPKVVWVGTEPEPALVALHDSIQSRVTIDPKPFAPHFSVGRVSPGSPAVGRMLESYVAEHPFPGTTLAVEEFHLYESLPSGEYAILDTFRLASAKLGA